MTDLTRQVKKKHADRTVPEIERRMTQLTEALSKLGMRITRAKCDTVPTLSGRIGKLEVQAVVWCPFHDVSRITVYAYKDRVLHGVVAVLLVKQDGTWTTEVNKVLDILLDREVSWDDT